MDSTNQQNQVSASVTAPGEGERRAIRGYIGQYDPAAVAIYMALDRGDLHWVGVADRTAGIADDLVLGLTGKVVAHQFKTSRFPDRFRVRTLLIGTNGLLRPLVVAWEALRLAHPGSSITIRLVTNDYPSTADSEADGASPHSAAFLVEFKAHPLRSLGEWRSSRWKQLIDDLFAASELTESDFDLFLSSLEILHGTDAEFASGYHLSADGVRLARDIAAILPRLVADKRDKDHWTRSELLHELGWRDSTVAHHVHQFPVGAYVQRNATTEAMLRDAIQRNLGGYVSLVGAPGAGKSTSLQISLEAVEDVFLVRYLAFIPGAGQGVGRGEADDFFDDIATQLKLTGLLGPRLHDQSLHERREQFSALIHAAGERFKADDVRTLIVIDGLDHVPREERPQRSFLAELPLPGAVPDGVLFILGTQRMNLDDIPPAVQDQASMVGRKVEMAPLSREAVHKMAQLLSLDADIDRDTIFALSHGHPLATRYLIEALRTADASIRDGLLAGAWTFDGDIEAVYESVWRGIRDDDKARSVLDYLARAEGPMPLELLVPLSSEAAIERALRAAGHLLSETEQGWSVFHNSFRLFILSKPRLRLGKPDSEYGIRLYRELAALARTAPGESPQHWLELRYTARAGDHASVLELATAVRFRQQFSERRSIPEIYADLRLAFEAARQTYDPLKVFQLLLTQNEMSRRWSVYEQVPTIVSAMLQVGDLDGAVAFVQHAPAAGYDVVDALLKAGQYARARALFQELEPLQQLLSGANFGNPPDQSELRDWVRRAIHFRDPEQIEQAILRLSKASHQESVLKDEQTAEHVADSLRLHAALAAIGTRDNDDVAEIGRQFGVDAALWGYLTIEAGLVAAERGATDLACERFHNASMSVVFLAIPNPWRIAMASVAARSSDTALACRIFDGLQRPSLADLASVYDDDTATRVVRDVLRHAEVAAILGRRLDDVDAPDPEPLKPLQFHIEAIGTVLGRARLEPLPVQTGEVAGIARKALAFLNQVRPRNGDHHAVSQVAQIAPLLGSALIQAAALCGEEAFAATIEEFDRSFADVNGNNCGRLNLRREVAVAIYRQSRGVEDASRRLELLVGLLQARTPEEQIEELAHLAKAFAQIGNMEKATALLSNLASESLGYTLPPKKDPQYATWCDLLRLSNEADPAGRADRVAMLLRQVVGMMRTEGYGAAHRIAAPLLKEAVQSDAAMGWHAARILVDQNAIGWARMVDALLLGIVKRRPDLACAATIAWCELALPYYVEPYFSESQLGSFIDTAIESTPQLDVAKVAEILLAAIEAESQAHERLTLLKRLARVAQARGVSSRSMKEACVRWSEESPPPRQYFTPDRYDDVTSLSELKTKLEQGAESEVDYQAARAFKRLAPSSNYSLALELFERWKTIRDDSRARSILINLAIDSDETTAARALIEQFDIKGNDRATWTKWTGGASLYHYEARLRLDGHQVHKEAYADFVASLVAGRESTTSVLNETDEIFAMLSDTPAWAGMWDALAEQLVTTREYVLGSSIAAIDCSLSDEDLIASLLAWGMGLSLDELHRHAVNGALRMTSIAGGEPVFASLVRRLLDGEGDEPASALHLLQLAANDRIAVQFSDRVLQLGKHVDFAVACQALTLARHWGLSPEQANKPLASFYSLILEDVETFEQPQLVNVVSGPMVIEDPLGWTHALEDQINLLASHGVSATHIRHRCRMFIEQWGGLTQFGVAATERLMSELRRLDMKMTYARPHMAAAARALRYVAGELWRGGVIPEEVIPSLLHMLGYPSPRPPQIQPVCRPAFIVRPMPSKENWETPGEEWLGGTSEDTLQLEARDETIVVELCEFHIRQSSHEYRMWRLRAPGLAPTARSHLAEGFERLSSAIWIGQGILATASPATTIARALLINRLPEVPNYRLIVCPHWLQRLAWHPHPSNELVILDKDDAVAARLVWWRDGGPVDCGENVVWGQGSYLSLTSSGRQQLEALIGRPDVTVLSGRGYVRGSDGGQETFRYAEARE